MMMVIMMMIMTILMMILIISVAGQEELVGRTASGSFFLSIVGPLFKFDSTNSYDYKIAANLQPLIFIFVVDVESIGIIPFYL